MDWVIGEEEELGLREDARQPATQTAKAAYVIDGEMKALFEKKYKDEVIMPAAVVVMAPAVGEGGKPVYVLARSAITGECPRGQCRFYHSWEWDFTNIDEAFSMPRLLTRLGTTL